MIDTVHYEIVVLQVFVMIGGDRAIDIEWQGTHYSLQGHHLGRAKSINCKALTCHAISHYVHMCLRCITQI